MNEVKKQQNKKMRIGIGVGITFLILIPSLFLAYTSKYYHCLGGNYAREANIEKQVVENWITYGDSSSKVGVVFYPGAKVEIESYEPILVELAQEGYFCVLMDMPYHLAVLDKDACDEAMETYAQVEQWYLAGHSLGGAVGAKYAYENREKLTGLILLAAYPTNTFPEDFPILSICATEDMVINQEHYQEQMQNNPNVKEYFIYGGNHGQFGNYGEQDGDGDATISPEAQWNETVKAMTEFMENSIQ